MLLVTLHNDGTGDENIANYDCKVLVTISPTKLQTIALGRVEGHKRGDGWRALLRKLADEGRDV